MPAAPPPEKPLRIGQVAKKLGVSPSMIRAWECIGLRATSAARSGSHRTYTDTDVALLQRAVYLRRVQGLNAPGILDQLRREGILDAQANGSGHARPIGNRLRMLRLRQKKSLAEVARAVDVSVGFLSSLERSQTNASIGILHRLAQFYNSNILDLFSRTTSSGPLVRASERQPLHGWNGVRMDLLAWGDTVMEPHLFHIQPGCGSKETYSHAGQEFLFLISGRLTITLNESDYKLVKGDSFYFESQVVHRWSNPGRTVATVLWINTPATL